MPGMIEGAVAWMTQTGPPNWVFLVALLTAPHLWARRIKSRLTPLLNRVLPLGSGENGEK